jgi:uncharacterized lipoprotein YehR (DUF1307 family)
MTISVNDLSLICNYIEINRPMLNQISYTSFVSSDDEDEILRQKSLNRELAIDCILENKDESYKLNKEFGYFNKESDAEMSTISTKIFTLNISPQRYIDDVDLFIDINKYLNSITNVKNKIYSSNYTLYNDPNLSLMENSDKNVRVILNKIQMCNNQIHKNSRFGPANNILIGLDVFDILVNSVYFHQLLQKNESPIIKGNFNGMNIIVSPYIDKNKIIVLRTSKSVESGLLVIKSKEDVKYSIKETHDFEKAIMWFEVN